MRNLKRALSLTLASVMLLGMMVVGAGAAGFPDVDEDNANIEAIEVLQAVEVMIGDDNGNFGPNDPVNRSQMAVVMAKLLNLDYQYYEASCDFWDVPTWARPYVGACYANKIVSGYGDGTYGAADPVTPVQAASMMMRALGYFQHSEDYQDGFETATVRQGTEVGIFEGVGSSATANMTRAQVARMALNALESEMVTFTGTPGTTYTTSTGESLSIGYRAEYTPRTSTELKYKAIEDRTSDASLDSNHRGQYYIQLGEELYNGKLVKKFDRDIFERPSINWQYDGKEIGVYVDYDLKVAEYLSAVKYNTLYDELTYTTIRDNDVLRFVDGKETTPFSKDSFARSNKNDLEGSGTGVLTEVFHDQQNKEITITSINTYLAQANNDYNTTNESLSMKVYDSKTGTTKIVDSTDVPAAVNVKKDEYRLVYMSAKENPSYEVVRMFDAEIMPDSEVTKWSKDDAKVVDSLTTGGTEYDANVKAFYDKANDVFEDYDYQLLTDITYNIYLDRYGNVIGVDEAEGVRNYVFITGYDRGKSHIATKTADANAIFLDGTMDVITVNVTDTNKNISNTKLNMGTYDVWNIQDGKVNENRWYTFTQSANGNYTLKPVARSIYTAYTSNDLGTNGVKTLNTANLYLDDSHVGTKYDSTAAYERQGRIYGNDDSIYITVEPGRVDLSCNVPSHDVNSTTNTSIDNVKDAITDVAGVYTGAQNVKIDLSLDTKQEINRDGRYDENGNVVSDQVCETGHDEHGDTNYKSSNERNAYVYSIYDSNYYVIASVVLGEAQGGAANYVYVLDGAKNERVERGSSSNGDTYYWEFEAVVDGEITTLTVKEKYSDTLKSNLKIHAMQEIRFDGDYVTAIKDIPVNDVFINYQGADTAKVAEKVKTDDMDVYDVGYVYNQDAWKAVGDYMDGDGKPTKSNESTKMAEMRDLFSDYKWSAAQRAGRIDGTIQLVGRTLYTDRANGDVGLALNTNAKAVLIQPENGKRVATNCGSVSEAIGRLADRYPDETANPGIQFQGRIAAVLDSNGAAKWVVIISDTNLRTGNTPDYGYNGRTYYLDLSGELFSGYSNSTSVWSSAENNNRGGYVEGYNLNSSTSGWGNTTRYEVRSGSTVVVRNYYTDAQMNWYFNNVYMDDIMQWNGRDGYTFVMPSENVAIEGRHNMRYTENIAGFTGEKIVSGANVTFNNLGAGVDLGKNVTTVNVRITMPNRSVSSLENGKWYTVTIGEWQREVDVLCAGSTLSFTYDVTDRDIAAKRVMVWDINLASGQSGNPAEPGATPVKTVVIDSANIPSSFESADKVPAGAQTLTVATDPANAATVTLTWGAPVDGKVTGTINVTANAGYNLTGTKITLGGKEITNGSTVTATVGGGEGDNVIGAVAINVAVPTAKDETLAQPTTETANVTVSGAWSPNADKAVEGENTLKVTVTAAEGYTLAADCAVTINGSAVTKNEDGTYTFVAAVDASAETKTIPSDSSDLYKLENLSASAVIGGDSATITVTGLDEMWSWYHVIVRGADGATLLEGAAQKANDKFAIRCAGLTEGDKADLSIVVNAIVGGSVAGNKYVDGTSFYDGGEGPFDVLTTAARARSVLAPEIASGEKPKGTLWEGTWKTADDSASVTLTYFSAEDGTRKMDLESLAALGKFLKANKDKTPVPSAPKAIPTVKGAADTVVVKTETGSNLKCRLGIPERAGVLLPDEVEITDEDGNVVMTAKVEWTYGASTVVLNKGQKAYATESNLNDYKYKLVTPTLVKQDEGGENVPMTEAESEDYFPMVVEPAFGGESEAKPVENIRDLSETTVAEQKVETGVVPPVDATVWEDVTFEGGVYTFNYKTEANRPSLEVIQDTIAKGQNAKKVEVSGLSKFGAQAIDAGSVKIYFEYGSAGETGLVSVALMPKAEVIYVDKTGAEKSLGFINKNGSNTIGVGSFNTGDILVAGDEGVKVGAVVTPETNGTIILQADACTVDGNEMTDQGQDKVYVYDAIKVKETTGVNVTDWTGATDAEKTDLLRADGADILAVVAGTELTVTGTAITKATAAQAGVYQLQANGKGVDDKRLRVEAAATVTPEYTVKITEDMKAEKADTNEPAAFAKGDVALSIGGPLVVYTVGENDWRFVIKTNTATAIEDLLPETAYIMEDDPDTDGSDKTGAAFGGGSTHKTDKNGKLSLTATDGVNDSSVREDSIIHAAYALTVTGGTAKLADSEKTFGTAIAAGAYVVPGAKVWVQGTTANGALSSEDVTLTRDSAAANSASGLIGYSFIMPEGDVTIKAGGAISVAPKTGNPGNLTKRDGEYVLVVTVPEGVTDKPSVGSTWPVNTDGQGNNTPSNLNWSKVEQGAADAVDKSTKWEITLKATDTVKAGTYYMPIIVGEETIYETLTVPVGVTAAKDDTQANPAKVTIGGAEAKCGVTATAGNSGTPTFAWTSDKETLTGQTNADFNAASLKTAGVHTLTCTVTEADDGVTTTAEVKFTVVVFPAAAAVIGGTAASTAKNGDSYVDTGINVTIPGGFTKDSVTISEGTDKASAAQIDESGNLSIVVTAAGSVKVKVTLSCGGQTMEYETGAITTTAD